MGFKFEKGKLYVMPVFFGPATVMCNDAGNNYRLYQPADGEILSVTFESNPAQLEALLPEGFSLNAPYVSVMANELSNIGWLAGNSYSLLSISVPVHFSGKVDEVDGDLVLAMFENHTEPIVAGREALGYSKIYAEIPRFNRYEDRYKVTASNWGFRFMKMTVDIKKPAANQQQLIELSQKSQGKLGYKYIIDSAPELADKSAIDSASEVCNPKEWGSDVAYPIFNPKTWTKPDNYHWEFKAPENTFCDGNVEFFSPEWEDMPNYYRIGKGLAELEVRNIVGAQHTLYSEPCAYGGIRALK